MKNALAIVSVTLLSAGCSPMLYSGYTRPPVTAPFGPPAAMGPLPIGRWDNVMRLPHGSTIDVLTPDGTPNVGLIQMATATTVTVQVDGHDVEIDRVRIIRVDLVDLPGSEAQAVARSGARGALLGAGAMALVGFVIGGSAWPPPGALIRAGVAGGAVSGVQSSLTNRQGRMIYLTPEQYRLYPAVPYATPPGRDAGSDGGEDEPGVQPGAPATASAPAARGRMVPLSRPGPASRPKR
jgi:hypothetical protein